MLDELTAVDPWNASFAEAPASTYVEPSSTEAGFTPLMVITGGTSSSYPSLVSAAIAPAPTTVNKTFCMAFSSAFISSNLCQCS